MVPPRHPRLAHDRGETVRMSVLKMSLLRMLAASIMCAAAWPLDTWRFCLTVMLTLVLQRIDFWAWSHGLRPLILPPPLPPRSP